jgi:hypothetical protein
VHNANPKNARKQASGHAGGTPRGKLQVGIYQLADDSMFAKNRIDGTGWHWSWADWRRDWMDDTPNKYAYRCLPLTIANQTGWVVRNPVGFTATWRGRLEPYAMEFVFDSNPQLWSGWINNHFGQGIITWNTPFLFRTKPAGSRLLIIGPANSFKHGVQPLTAIIESDWISMSFTMNWKFTAPHLPVRFEVGEPLFQAIPIGTNLCADQEQADVTYQKLADDPEIQKSYLEWSAGRKKFHEQKQRGEAKPGDWQRDYFQGRDAFGNEVAPEHMTKITPPKIKRK